MSRKKSKEELLNKAGISEKEFEKLYLIDEWSLVDFKSKYKFTYAQTQRILDELKIKKRNISESKRTKRVKKKFVASIEEKYGVRNPSQAEEVKQKKRQTFIKNYGVDNIWKSKDYYVELHKTMLKKYGAKSVPNLHGNANPYGIKTISKKEKKDRLKKAHDGFKKWWKNLTDEQRNEVIESRCNNLVNHYRSSLETKVSKALENLNIKHKHQFWIRGKSYDFLLLNSNLVIEVQGDFWHANPKKYKASDILNFPNGKVTAKDLWEKDKIKKIAAEDLGYKLIYIWESEMRVLTQPEMMELLIKKIYED